MKPKLFTEMEKITFSHDERMETNRNEAWTISTGMLLFVVITTYFWESWSIETRYNVIQTASMMIIPLYNLILCLNASLYNTLRDKVFLILGGLAISGRVCVPLTDYLIAHVPIRMPVLVVLLMLPLAMWIYLRLHYQLYLWGQRRLEADGENDG